MPGDPALRVRNRWIAPAGPYQGRRRMTFTFPTINAARLVVWQVTDGGKAGALREALQGRKVPASRVRRHDVHVVATHAAAAQLDRR